MKDLVPISIGTILNFLNPYIIKFLSFRTNKVITLNTICIHYINRFIQRGETHGTN